MPSITINYYEYYGEQRQQLLGTEILDLIEEALLPQNPEFRKNATTGIVRQDKIFASKKFVGRPEYRWQVLQVASYCEINSHSVIFDVELASRSQVEKSRCLTQIIKQRKAIQRQSVTAFLRPYYLVEVEYGHAMSIGKLDGELKSNKRYPESFQFGSMPKRRLAIALKIISRSNVGVLIQVLPISSVKPKDDDLSCIEVTAMIAPFNFPNYQKQSWAISSMVETVSATRVFAPKRRGEGIGFHAELKGAHKRRIQEALVHGVGVQVVVEEKNDEIGKLNKLISALRGEIETLREQLKHDQVHEEMAREYAEATDAPFEQERQKRLDLVPV